MKEKISIIGLVFGVYTVMSRHIIDLIPFITFACLCSPHRPSAVLS